MINQESLRDNILKNLVVEFKKLTGYEPEFDLKYLTSLKPYVAYLGKKQLRNLEERERDFIALVNKKFELNSKVIAELYAQVAKLGYTFNFHQKNDIQKAFDSNDKDIFLGVMKSRKINKNEINSLTRLFNPISRRLTLNHIKKECENPSKLRIEEDGRNIKSEILKTLFSAYLWGSLPIKEMHAYFDPHFSEKDYQESFWDQLHSRSVGLFNRENTLTIVRINQETLKGIDSMESARNMCMNLVSSTFKELNNFGVFAIVLERLEIAGSPIQWELSANITLMAEKFNETPLKKAYFQWEKIKKSTNEYIGQIEDKDARFDLVNEGFIYKDTFILTNKEGGIEKLLLLFQKNERDETLIPCPTCRSEEIEGNSYSSLGVRSWECNNLFCPDRTKYNRGKRYSFRNLLMQQAITDENNTIPKESIRRWHRDVVTDVSNDEILDMLVRHYTVYGDTIHLYNWDVKYEKLLGRKFTQKEIPLDKTTNNFLNSHFFKRFIVQSHKKPSSLKNLGDQGFQLYQGNSAEVLRALSENSFDGAVTSPPYFNAREYSQWPNIYCYLYDMFDVNKEVFRTLKEGGIYLYNLFDYFDNEKIVALSAMGQKRIPLAAYTVDLFRRIGFQLLGNIVWDKGDIEGKRGFNAGNFSPFYQSPFNCWEHILIFQKPLKNGNVSPIGESILRSSEKIFFCSPVIKMIRGTNVHGHTAPFPSEIPKILTSLLPKGSIILDPFAGSMTTGRVAEEDGLRSTCIELSIEYCQLGLEKRNLGIEKRKIKTNVLNKTMPLLQTRF